VAKVYVYAVGIVSRARTHAKASGPAAPGIASSTVTPELGSTAALATTQRPWTLAAASANLWRPATFAT
jgi:hypothetical protein